MKGHELAKELKVDNAVVAKLSDKHINAELSEDEVAAIVSAIEEGEAVVAAKPAKKVVRFWSEVKDHAFIVEGRLVYFEDYVLDVYEGGPAYNALVALKDPDIRIVEDGPFEDLGMSKDFRALLEDRLYTGPQREPSAIRGLAFVNGLFRGADLEEAAKALRDFGTAGLVELAIRKKSYRVVK
jgi:hypothetical protein